MEPLYSARHHFLFNLFLKRSVLVFSSCVFLLKDLNQAMPSFLLYFASLLSDTKPDLLSSAPPGSGLYLKNSSQIFLSSAPPGSDLYLKNSALCLLLSLCFVLMFCVSCRFSQGCTVRGHRECRSNSKSVGVPLIWALENWTTTPITQALFWISPVLLPQHFPF